MSDIYQSVREEMCDIGRRIWQRGYCAGNEGNHTVRVADDRVLCTPTGLSKGFMEPADICLVDMDGQPVQANDRGRKPTSELLLHLAIYRQRPDVQSVVHSHPPHATAFAIANIPLPRGIHPEAEVFLGKVPLAPFAMLSTQALPDSVTPLIESDTSTVIMGNHGVVTFASTLEEAYYNLEIVDAYCRLLLLAHPLRHIQTLSAEHLEQLGELKARFRPGGASPGQPNDPLADNGDFFSTLR